MKHSCKIILRITLYALLPALLFAQAGWGPDVRLTFRQGAGRDPRAACCGDTIHIVWWQSYAPGHDEVIYKRSIDTGETWETDVRLTPEDSITAVLPTITIWGSNVHVVWKEQTVYYQAICYRKSENSGETWGSIDTIYKTNQDGWYHPWISAHDSNLFVVAIKSGTGGELVFVKSTDNGISWSTPQIITSAQDRPRIENFKTGAVFLVVVYGDGTEIYSVRSFTAGETWTDSQVVSDNDGIASQCPAMNTDDSTGIHITWYDYKYSPYPWTGDIFYRASRDSGTTWEPIDSLTVMHRARHSDILAEGNNLHIVWDDDRYGINENNEILYRMSTDLGQTWANDMRLTEAEGNSHNPALTCDGNYLHLFWCDCRDSTGNVAIYYKRKDLSQGVAEITQLIRPMWSRFEVYPTLFYEKIRIKQSTWGTEQGGKKYSMNNDPIFCALYIKVYDISGKEVIGETKREMERSGVSKTVQLDTKDLPCGVYFVELEAGDIREVHKVVKAK